MDNFVEVLKKEAAAVPVCPIFLFTSHYLFYVLVSNHNSAAEIPFSKCSILELCSFWLHL
jgi:hypothetical protein